MSLYFKYLDQPPIPKDLHSEVYDSLLINPNHFTYSKVPYYKIHLARKNLETFCKDLFPSSQSISVQIIRKGIPIHKDIGRKEAINFIITPGGSNVFTCFYQDNILIEKHKIEPLRWHWLNVSVFHSVIGLDDHNPRVSVTVSV